MNKKLLFVVCLFGMFVSTHACTNFIVGKKASVDGSVMVSYSADSYGCYGVMQHFPAAVHKKGEKRKVFDWETNRYLGEIAEAPVTYNVVGNMNEYQLTIAETTFGGRKELEDTTGIIDYGSLIYITLQRAKTAREAIDVMTSLVTEYGYCSEGESFSICDPNEAWIMEMIGKGPGVKGALWVAVRIPDDCISGHANQSRIHKFMHYDKKDCIYAKDVISFARKKGLYSGKDVDFDFADTYCPLDFSGARACEARVWSFYNVWVDDMDRYLDYAMGLDLEAEPMALYYRPKAKLSVHDVETAMRNQYEGTPMDMTKDPGAGTYLSPYRPRPLTWEYKGVKYFNERPVGTQQTSFTFVSQMRSFLPDCIGGVLWFGHDDAKMVAYTPVYCCATSVPDCYTKKYGDDVTFSFKSAFWVCNWISNMVYPRYSLLFPDLEKKRDELEKHYFDKQKSVEEAALKRYKEDENSAVKYLTQYSRIAAEGMLRQWVNLGKYLIVKYNDLVVKPDDNGVFLRTVDGLGERVQSVGYPDSTRAHIIEQTGSRFRVLEKNK